MLVYLRTGPRKFAFVENDLEGHSKSLINFALFGR